jgi:hypothetical protein
MINERIANSFIKKIEAYHYPDGAQRKNTPGLLEIFCWSESIKELISIKTDLQRTE